MANKIFNMSDVDMEDEGESTQGWDEKDTTIVAELSLTQHEVGSMRYVFNQWLGQYNSNEYSPLKKDIQGLLGALNEL
jgi:hypothetical protein